MPYYKLCTTATRVTKSKLQLSSPRGPIWQYDNMIIFYFLSTSLKVCTNGRIGLSQNYIIFIGCWKWTTNANDVIMGRSYVGPSLPLVQRPRIKIIPSCSNCILVLFLLLTNVRCWVTIAYHIPAMSSIDAAEACPMKRTVSFLLHYLFFTCLRR